MYIDITGTMAHTSPPASIIIVPLELESAKLSPCKVAL